MRKTHRISLVMAIAMLCSCVMQTKSVAERRAAVQSMRSDVLNALYSLKASASAEVTGAPGYGVFSNANVNVVLASVGGGYGVIRNNQTRTDTYMKMGEVGLGIGAGVKDYRLVFVFHDVETMNDFIEKGWSFGGQADAAAKAGDKGAAIGGEAVIDGVSIYQLTQSGLALQATLKGTRYWKDNELN